MACPCSSCTAGLGFCPALSSSGSGFRAVIFLPRQGPWGVAKLGLLLVPGGLGG